MEFLQFLGSELFVIWAVQKGHFFEILANGLITCKTQSRSFQLDLSQPRDLGWLRFEMSLTRQALGVDATREALAGGIKLPPSHLLLTQYLHNA